MRKLSYGGVKQDEVIEIESFLDPLLSRGGEARRDTPGEDRQNHFRNLLSAKRAR